MENSFLSLLPLLITIVMALIIKQTLVPSMKLKKERSPLVILVEKKTIPWVSMIWTKKRSIVSYFVAVGGLVNAYVGLAVTAVSIAIALEILNAIAN